jgi:hypothetical protein
MYLNAKTIYGTIALILFPSKFLFCNVKNINAELLLHCFVCWNLFLSWTQHMSYKLYKIGCDQLVIKGILHQEQCIIWL